ncbi:heptaprenyl diphosphate synthase component 1 [Alicyclobacillus mengziensis]|uniref:Heptaprenyl diphosphate synthase component 1 n=1 Tax=Alicyclobacillus mengziensis TaxID=2931921 RepID=A0A9X7VV98_9BACL|nr:heptaprenyl diphosphate synthase component 1 [Alicyclobacillus mengziensis]QSO45733.1 heptaprenyl diphosphate synthase component 1 [Alicyclobacillus mengziensis]
MAMTDVNFIRFEDIDNKVRAYTHHAFLHAANVRPYASRFHFDMAKGVLEAAGLSRRASIAILEAVLLLHRGLAIHEEVDNTTELQRQLRVLAGDYCSSQYYWIIARVGNERLVQALSDAVVHINEAKMTLHRHRDAWSAESYMQLQETIHGELLFTLAETYLPGDTGWRLALRGAIRAYVVQAEVESRSDEKPFSVRQGFEWISEVKERLFQSPIAASLQPVNAFVLRTWSTLRNLQEKQSLAEGNR